MSFCFLVGLDLFLGEYVVSREVRVVGIFSWKEMIGVENLFFINMKDFILLGVLFCCLCDGSCDKL